MPNNRQWATIIWCVVLFAFFLFKRDLRVSLVQIFRAACAPKFVGMVLVLIAWVLGLIALGRPVGLWGPARLTDTLFWLVSAFVVLGRGIEKVSKQRHFVRRTAFATLELSAFVEVLSEIFVLRLWAELLLLPVLAFLGMMSAVGGSKPEFELVKRLVTWLIAITSLTLLAFVAVSLIKDRSNLDKGDLAQQFALPIWLTVGILPYIYLVGLLAAYEVAFLRMDWKSDNRWHQRFRVKLALFFSFHARALEIGAFHCPWSIRIGEAKSFRDARRIVEEFRRDRGETARRQAAATARLERFAGVDGVDEDGRRLDRREFEATIDALRWVATCQMGWFNREDGTRYRENLLDFVLEGHAGSGLPRPHDVEMKVSSNGQRWFAWRTTVSGWVFGVGAETSPPDQWLYDGPTPPEGFPGEDSAWGSAPFDVSSSPNWNPPED